MRKRTKANEQGGGRAAESSRSMTLTVPALPNIIRLRSPPISERATDGSSDKEGKAEFLPAPMPPVVPFGSWNYPDAAKSFTAVEISRREETRKGPAPAAPLTTQNLTQYQEEIGSAREQPPHEIATGFEVSMSATSQMGGSSKQADSFEWTKKFVDFQRRQRGRAGKEPEEDRKLLLRQLTEPLNSGKGLPSPTQAIELINDQIMKENTISKRNDEIEYDRLWALTQDLPAASQERKYFSMDRWSGQPGLSSADLPVERQHFEIPYSQMGKQIGTPSCRLPPDELGFREYPEDMGVTSPKLEKGNLPSEIMNFNRETDVHTLDMILDPGTMDLSDDNQSPFIFGETPLLQAVMSDQIENDLAAVSSEDDNPNEGADATKQSKQSFSSPTVPTTIKFALPEATQDEIVKSEAYFRALDVPTFFKAVSPAKPAGPSKRKIGQQMSISEVEVKRLRIGTSRNGIQVEDNIYEFDKTLEADLDSLFEESEDATYPDMSGALQDMEGIEGEAGQDDDCYFGSDPLFGD